MKNLTTLVAVANTTPTTPSVESIELSIIRQEKSLITLENELNKVKELNLSSPEMLNSIFNVELALERGYLFLEDLQEEKEEELIKAGEEIEDMLFDLQPLNIRGLRKNIIINNSDDVTGLDNVSIKSNHRHNLASREYKSLQKGYSLEKKERISKKRKSQKKNKRMMKESFFASYEMEYNEAEESFNILIEQASVELDKLISNFGVEVVKAALALK